MNKTIIVCGYGTGISDAVAHKFGGEGYSVALVARSKDKLAAGVKGLEAKGIKAKAFQTDLANAGAVKELIAQVRKDLGPIGIVHWNAYPMAAGDLTTAGIGEIKSLFDVSVFGLVVAVQEALPDLRKAELPSILITGGGLSAYDPQVDAMAVSWNAMGLALAKSAQRKLTGLLAEKLRAEKIYVGEVTVMGMVKGTAFDSGNATIEPKAVAQKFWDLHTERKATVIGIS